MTGDGMKVEQTRWTESGGWTPHRPGQLVRDAQLVLLFGSRQVLLKKAPRQAVQEAYPAAKVLGCSTAGEICGTTVLDDSLVATAIHFERTRVKGARMAIADVADSVRAGQQLAQALDRDGLRHVFVLSDGLHINGSELVRGLREHLPADVTVTGGLSGDGDAFKETLVLWDGPPQSHMVAVLGFYGPHLKVGYASLGGWDPFGPERVITKSSGNRLYELDGKSALALYKKYLGDHAKDLPAAGLLFPLSLRVPGESGAGVVRTILSVDEGEQSMTFAGDMPEGAYARLMKANFDRLIDGAVGAARTSAAALGQGGADLAILISCVGRKLVLKQRVEEEVEGVRDVLGPQAVMTGFYSYGEISPFTPHARCELHNQTMTITTFAERPT